MSFFFPVRISAEDLSKLFDIVELCSVSPDTLVEGNKPVSPVSPASPSTWTISEHEGRWVSGSSAGGSRKYRSMFVTMNYGFELILRANLNDRVLFNFSFFKTQSLSGRILSSS